MTATLTKTTSCNWCGSPHSGDNPRVELGGGRIGCSTCSAHRPLIEEKVLAHTKAVDIARLLGIRVMHGDDPKRFEVELRAKVERVLELIAGPVTLPTGG